MSEQSFENLEYSDRRFESMMNGFCCDTLLKLINITTKQELGNYASVDDCFDLCPFLGTECYDQVKCELMKKGWSVFSDADDPCQYFLFLIPIED